MNTDSSDTIAQKKTLYGLDPSKYPSRMGQPWNDDEIVKLLRSIQKKKPVEQIAEEHERTVGGIQSRIYTLALDYHFNDKRPMEEIQRFTGLTKEQIEAAIRKRVATESMKKKPVEKVLAEPKAEPNAEPTTTELLSLLKDIREKLNILLARESHLNGCPTRCD
jgi:hypothetical protein